MTINPAIEATRTDIAPTEVDAYARKAVIASCLGYAVDGFDLLLLSFILASVSAALHLSAPEAGSAVGRARRSATAVAVVQIPASSADLVAQQVLRRTDSVAIRATGRSDCGDRRLPVRACGDEGRAGTAAIRG